MRTITLVLSIAALLAGARLTLAAAPPAHAPTLSVTLDGEPMEVDVHSLDGAPDQPQAGDMAAVAGYALTLSDTDSHLTLTTDERHPGRLYLARRDGGRTLIAVKVRSDHAGDRSAVLNPFPAMTPEEIAGLRGVVIEAWAPELRDALGALPPSAAVRIDVGMGQVSPILEALPERLERLWLEWRDDDDDRLVPALGRLEHLRALVLDLPNTGFDAAALGERAALRTLMIRARGLDNAAALAGLAGLRSLVLTWCGGVEDVGFVHAMPELRRLRIAYTEVSSLAALEGHAAIETVDADASEVEMLPAGATPSLRELRLLGSSTPEAEIERFKGANPGCRVVHRWGASLHEGLAGCDRLRVRSGGTCHRDRDSEETLFEADGAAAVEAVLKLIEIDEDRSGFHCRCCGDPTLEFYRGGELVGMVGFHHGQSLRWVGGWPADGALTRPSAAKLVQWLADEGVTEPLQERRVEDEREQAAMRRLRLYESVIPPDALAALNEAGSKEEAVAAFRQGLEPNETAALM